MRRALKPIWVLLALVFLFEAWLWSHLAPLVAWLVDRLALPTLKVRAAARIERLLPWADARTRLAARPGPLRSASSGASCIRRRMQA